MAMRNLLLLGELFRCHHHLLLLAVRWATRCQDDAFTDASDGPWRSGCSARLVVRAVLRQLFESIIIMAVLL
eukprot:scaffold18449_cov49-Attheya_sp.AAC.3